MQITLPYGSGRIDFKADEGIAEWHVIRKESVKPVGDPRQEFIKSCRKPIASKPLCDVIKPSDRVIIVTCDGTRPFPNRLILPWLLAELNMPDDQVTVLLGNGTHRKNTKAEIRSMFGEETIRRVKILNHDCYDAGQNRLTGVTETGGKILINRLYTEADKRIVLGFIEPHFFAGFSGGAKGVVPGIAGLETILHVHRPELIANPLSTWGETERNPVRDEIDKMVSGCPPDFLINVTLNPDMEITGYYSGDYREAHRKGCREALKESSARVDAPFPVVITTNGGYPLDQNLYQTVKGISGAARIVEPGGYILIASECRDGIPDHGQFANIMSKESTPEKILNYIHSSPGPPVDQWQAQILAMILKKAKVGLFSSLAQADVHGCLLRPIPDLQQEINEVTGSGRRNLKIAVLPDGPLIIPTLVDE